MATRDAIAAMSAAELYRPGKSQAAQRQAATPRFTPLIKITAVHSQRAIELALPDMLAGIHPVIHPMYLQPAARASTRGTTHGDGHRVVHIPATTVLQTSSCETVPSVTYITLPIRRYCGVEGYLQALSAMGYTMSGCGRANFVGRPHTVNMPPHSAGVKNLAKQVSILCYANLVEVHQRDENLIVCCNARASWCAIMQR
jgi:hypothetical protein